MSTKKQNADVLVNEVIFDISQLSSVFRLCAFAAEARRTLLTIDKIATLDKNIGERLDMLVEARNEWTLHEDNLAVVIRETTEHLDAARERLESLFF